MTQVSIIDVPTAPAPKPKRSRVGASILAALGFGRREGESLASAVTRTSDEAIREYATALREAIAERKRREPAWRERISAVAARGGFAYDEAREAVATERDEILSGDALGVLADLLNKTPDDVQADAKLVERFDTLSAAIAAVDDTTLNAELQAATVQLRDAAEAARKAEIARLAAHQRHAAANGASERRMLSRQELDTLLAQHPDLLASPSTSPKGGSSNA